MSTTPPRPSGASLAEQQLSAVLEGIGEAFYVLDRDWRFVFASQSALKMWGRRSDEIVGRPFLDCFPGAAGSDAYSAHVRVMQTGIAERFETISPVLNHWIEVEITVPAMGGLSVSFRDIQARKLVEEALRESEERRELALEATQVGTFVWHVLEDRGEPDARMLALFDQPLDGTLTLRDAIATMIHPDDAQRYADAVAEAARPEGSRNLREDIRVRRPDGGWRWVAITAKIQFDAAGRPMRMAGTGLDISDRKQAEARLRESEERREFALEATELGAFVWNVPEDRTDADARMMALLDNQVEGLSLREAMASMIHPDDAQRYADAAVASLRPDGSRRFREDVRMRRLDGSWRWLSITGQTYFDDTGHALRMIGTALDITVRKRTELALRESEERQVFLLKLSDALRSLADPVKMQDIAARMVGEHLGADRAYYAYVEGEFEFAVIEREYVRGDAPSVVGRHRFSDFDAVRKAYLNGQNLVVDDVEAPGASSEQDLASYRAISVRSYLGVLLVKDGKAVASMNVLSQTPHHWTAQEIELLSETAERTWAAVERAKAETALRESEERYRSLFESMAEGFGVCGVIRDADGRVVDLTYVELNKAYERLTGLDRTVMIGRRFSDFFPAADLARWMPIYARVIDSGEAVTFEQYTEVLDRWYEASVYPRDGAHISIFFRDVTAAKRAEALLRASEERQAFLLKLSDTLRPLTDPVETKKAALKLLAEHLQVMRASYYRVEDDQDTFSVTEQHARRHPASGKDANVRFCPRNVRSLPGRANRRLPRYRDGNASRVGPGLLSSAQHSRLGGRAAR